VFASVIWIFVQPLWSFPTDLSAKVWLELLWIGIVGTALPFLFGFSALRRAASGIVGVISTTEPVFAATAAWILLGQYLSVIQMVGGAMVLGAAAAIQRWGTTETKDSVETVN